MTANRLSATIKGNRGSRTGFLPTCQTFMKNSSSMVTIMWTLEWNEIENERLQMPIAVNLMESQRQVSSEHSRRPSVNRETKFCWTSRVNQSLDLFTKGYRLGQQLALQCTARWDLEAWLNNSQQLLKIYVLNDWERNRGISNECDMMRGPSFLGRAMKLALNKPAILTDCTLHIRFWNMFALIVLPQVACTLWFHVDYRAFAASRYIISSIFLGKGKMGPDDTPSLLARSTTMRFLTSNHFRFFHPDCRSASR